MDTTRRNQTIAHLQIALLEIAYATADARRRILSLEPGTDPLPLEKLIFKLDAASQAINLAISILEAPAFTKLALEAA